MKTEHKAEREEKREAKQVEQKVKLEAEQAR